MIRRTVHTIDAQNEPGTGTTSRTRSGNPPGPRNLNGPTGLTWRHAWQMVFDPLRFARKTARRYGDISFFRLFGLRAYLLNHPDLISQVLIHEAASFEKLPRQMKVIGQIFGRGILVTEGKQWKTDRQFVQRGFDESLTRRNSEYSVILTEKMLDRWATGQDVEVVSEMTRLTAEIASATFVGEDDPQLVAQLADAILFLSDHFSHEMNSAIRLPDWLPLPRKKRKREMLAFYNRFFDSLISKRLSSRDRRSNDLLQFLLDQPVPPGAGPDYVRDQLLTILIAAYHATSMGMVWIFHALDQHPEVERKLVDEIRQVVGHRRITRVDLANMEWLRCTVQETLRLYPPAWSLFCRQSIRPVEMRGYLINPGGWFYIMPFVTHRSEQFFPDPLRFDPDRFSAERIREIPKNAWFPFGLGGHACIGSRLAMEQFQLMLATLLQRVNLRHRTPGYEPRMEAKLALRPTGPVWMRVTRAGNSRPD